MSDLKEFYGKDVGKKCSVCGAELKGPFYENKPLCYSCFKRQIKGSQREKIYSESRKNERFGGDY